MNLRLLLLLSILFTLSNCQNNKPKSPTLFEEMSPEACGISFVNNVENTEKFNIFSYRNFYNGGGVSTGDLNNDGLVDVYFTNNMGENKLFLNEGNFKFKDITQTAGVAGTKNWSTGVAMVDLNNDGLLDIYVCNAGYDRAETQGGKRENELFINNGDLTFTEKAAEYQLDETGYTTHAAFFDYDLDGDLDCYILNNSFMPVNTLNYSNKREVYAKDWPVKEFLKGGGDKLLRNDNGKFNDVTEEAGVYGSLIGFGLGITIGDVNGDNLLDMYVSNDFFERDYLYINQGNGTFKEDIKNWMQHLSLSSMGADMADINNDGYPEIFVTEMLPESDYRRKTTTMFENYNTYYLKQQRGFYHQYMQNTLQLNNQNGTFSEIANYAGVAASDWSWGALMFDADNDGYRDIYICNGVYQDVTDQDFINFFANDVMQKMALTGKKEEMQSVIDNMPSNPQINKLFVNDKNLNFKDLGIEWGFNKPSFSNGAAYADLDNDGDLDLVINNLNQEALVYKNNSENFNQNHHLSIQLKGSDKNTFAIGAKVLLYQNTKILNAQLIPTRGFQSSIDYKITFGLGDNPNIDSLVIIWPDLQKSVLENPLTDTLLTIDFKTIGKTTISKNNKIDPKNKLFQQVAVPFETPEEDQFIDFFQEGLTIRMLSQEGPATAIGDVNGDKKDDIFIGGASGKFAHLYLQNGMDFTKKLNLAFERIGNSEDTAAEFFDADGDGDLDLYVGTGGNNRPAASRDMQDRLLLNDGQGSFTYAERNLPINGLNTSVVIPYDFDGDKDLDLFVGSRSVPNQYGVPARSFLFENDGMGKFTDVTRTKAPDFIDFGMVTDAKMVDIDGDKKQELVVIGEWMSPIIFNINKGTFTKIERNLSDYSGWWYALEAADVDDDGDNDLIMGNRGENFYFTGSAENPVKLWVYDYDKNGTAEKIITQQIEGRDMPVVMKKDLTDQLASLKKQNLKHTEYANKSIQDLFAKELIEESYVTVGNYFKSVVALNDGNGNFTLKPLPQSVQFSCVCDIYCEDLNADGQPDLVLGGNDSGFMPQFSKLDASFGQVLLNEGNGDFSLLKSEESGLFIRGDVKAIQAVKVGTNDFLLVSINGEKPVMYEIQK